MSEIPSKALNDSRASLEEIMTEVELEGLSPDERLKLIEYASLDDYLTAIDMIHRKVAPDHSHDPHAEAVKIVNPKGEVTAYTAKPEERAEILEYALEKAKQVVQKYHQESGSVEDALWRCGNLAAFGVVLAHIYKDGNGRTARTLGELIHNGFESGSPQSVLNLTTFSGNRPTKGFRVSSYVPAGEWGVGRADQDPRAFLDIVAALDAPLDNTSYVAATRGKFTTPRM